MRTASECPSDAELLDEAADKLTYYISLFEKRFGEKGGFSGGVSDEITKACEQYLESERAAEKIAVEEDLNRRRRELEELKRELEELNREGRR